MIEGIFVDGLVFSIMVIGILISYRILNFADLTCDGSVATGAAIATMAIVGGLPITVALLLSFLGGVAAGMVTAAIHNKLKIPGLLAGILTMTMLYSINLRILGNKANVPLLRVTTLYTKLPQYFSFLSPEWASLVGTLMVVLFVKVIVDLFFRADLGVSMGAMGGNEQMVISQGINPETLKLMGIGLSMASSPSPAASWPNTRALPTPARPGDGRPGTRRHHDRRVLFSSNRISLLTLRAIFGAIIYKALMFFGRKYGYLVNITPNDFKLLTGILVIASLFIAQGRSAASSAGAKRKAIARSQQRHDSEEDTTHA